VYFYNILPERYGPFPDFSPCSVRESPSSELPMSSIGIERMKGCFTSLLNAVLGYIGTATSEGIKRRMIAFSDIQYLYMYANQMRTHEH